MNYSCAAEDPSLQTYLRHASHTLDAFNGEHNGKRTIKMIVIVAPDDAKTRYDGLKKSFCVNHSGLLCSSL